MKHELFSYKYRNREKAMPLIFKPLGLEVLLFFFSFFFFSFSFPFFSFLFCCCYFVLVFWSRCLRFNLQGQTLTVGELTLQYKLSSYSGRAWMVELCTALSALSPDPLWLSAEECVLPFVCMCLTWRNNSRANLVVCMIESREWRDAYLRKIISVIWF